MENGRYAFTCLVSSIIAVTIFWSYLVSPMANRIGLKVSSGEDPDTAKINYQAFTGNPKQISAAFTHCA